MDENFTNPATQIMPEVNPSTVMTINKTPARPQNTQQSSMIDSFVKNDSSNDESIQTLTISFSVIPKDNEVKGIALMQAVIEACEKVGADISNLSIRKDDKK
jgi:hypothetical protein